MFTCPQCGNVLDIPSVNSGWWKDTRSSGPVSLGCGTLIVIALIVSFFSRGRDDGDAIRALQKEIQVLEQKIDRLEPAAIAPPQLPAEKPD